MVNLLRIYPKKLASVLAGRIAFMSLPKIIRVSLLRLFARHYGVNLDEAEKPLEDYKSLQEFFTRRLKPGARPQDEIVPGAINCPVDGRLVTLGRISDGTLIQAKGLSYSLKELLKFTPGPERFEGGHFLTLYLSPKDYHRIHVPLEGVVQAVARVEGELWPVNDASVTRVPRLYERNRRATWLAQGRGLDEGLLVACVLVGATHVGGCVIDERWLGGRDLTRNGGFEVSDLQCAQGDDLGLFQFGSTVVLLVGGLRANSWQPIAAEGLMKVGQRLGEFR
ncbi:MAG: archaetidylserine decarboxylase [Holophagales bacterium]|jgi:phosphatidylserine decarboxylase|nr:archaetidylserine decarboxylase [Holophagales bacterium]